MGVGDVALLLPALMQAWPRNVAEVVAESLRLCRLFARKLSSQSRRMIMVFCTTDSS